MKIYLANSLTQAPESYKQEMLELRQKLKENFEILEYLGLINGDAKQVFEHDLNCVKTCDAIVAEVSYPSTGLGFEIATALDAGKKVIAFAKQDAKISRMIMGINYSNFKFFRYSTLEEILNITKNILY